MNNKEKFLSIVRKTLFKLRNENASFFDELPISSRNDMDMNKPLVDLGFVFRTYNHENTRIGNEQGLKVREIGSIAIDEIFSDFLDDITVDLKSHSLSTGIDTLAMGQRKNSIIHLNKIKRSKASAFGLLISHLPLDISVDIDTIAILELGFEIICYEHEEHIVLLSRDTNCHVCGEELNVLFDINSFKISLFPTFSSKTSTELKDPELCQYPNGIQSYSNVINTPSKKIIFSNDFRSLLKPSSMSNDDYIDSKFENYVTIGSASLAHVYNTEYYVKHHNMMYIQSGDGSISIFQNKDLSLEFKPEFTYHEETGDVYNGTEGQVYLGGISFELWALCAMDLEQFITLCRAAGREDSVDSLINKVEGVVANVNSERFEFTSYYLCQDKDMLLGVARCV